MTTEAEVWIGWTTKRAKVPNPKDDRVFGDQQRSINRATNRAHDEDVVIERLREHYPALYRGDEDVFFSDNEMAGLLERVLDGRGGHSYRNRHNFLIKGLMKGNRTLGWRMKVPAPITVALPEQSLFTPESYAELGGGDALYEAFWGDLHTPIPGGALSPQSRDAGQLLFSCLMDSACISPFWFKALPASIRRGCSVHGDLVWLDLEPKPSEDSTDIDGRRRFFPAPITQLLLQRWSDRWHQKGGGTSWPLEVKSQDSISAKTLLLQYSDMLSKAMGLRKVSHSRLISVTETRAAQQMPTVLVHYLRSPKLGKSVSEINFLRLISGEYPKETYKSVMSELGEMPVHKKDFELTPTGSNDEFPDQMALFRRLKIIMNEKKQGTKKPVEQKKTLSAVQAFYTENALTPILQLLIIWACAHLETGGGSGKGLAATAVRYLDRIGKPLVAQASAIVYPGSMDSDQWQDIYDNSLSYGSGMTGADAGQLAQFFRFLTVNYSVPAVEFDRILGSNNVDASILTPREYDAVKKFLRQRPKDELSDVYELVLILGYRCGLRRSEVWSRVIKDFDGFDNPLISKVELLARPNKWANIKSWCGTRRLPLWLLLDDTELELLKSFYRRRRDRVVGSSAHHAVFANDMATGEPFDEGVVFDIITKTIQFVTGDDRFRFHHLRHSFVSITFLRLMESKFQKHLPKSWIYDAQGKPLLPHSEEFLAELVSAPHSTCPLSVVSMWAGHASVRETLRSYSHLLDWIVRSYFWDRKNPELSIARQSALLGKSSKAVEKYRYRNLEEGELHLHAADVCNLFVQQWRKTTLKKLPFLIERPSCVVDTGALQEEVWHPKERLLAAYELTYYSEEMIQNLAGERQPRGLEAAASKLNVPIKDAVRWMSNANILMSMRTSRKRDPIADHIFTGPIPKRTRMSVETMGVKRSLDQKDLLAGYPELRAFIAPPRTPTGRKYSALWYATLLAWEKESTEESQNTMRMVLEHSQRIRARIKVRSIDNQIKYKKLLERLGLKKRLRLIVNCLPSADKSRIRKYWAAVYDLPLSAVSISTAEDVNARLGVDGRSHLYIEELDCLVQYSKEGKKNHDAFWWAFRFALMSALTVTGKLHTKCTMGDKDSRVLTEFDES
jgi:integrase